MKGNTDSTKLSSASSRPIFPRTIDPSSSASSEADQNMSESNECAGGMMLKYEVQPPATSTVAERSRSYMRITISGAQPSRVDHASAGSRDGSREVEVVRRSVLGSEKSTVSGCAPRELELLVQGDRPRCPPERRRLFPSRQIVRAPLWTRRWRLERRATR